MAAVKDWMKAFRLRTLPLSLSGIVVGGMYAYSSSKWSGLIFGMALLTTVLFQIISNLANDLGDTLKGADNEKRVGPQRTVQSGAISVQDMKKAVLIFSILSLLSAALLIFFSKDQLSLNYQLGYVGLAICCVLAALGYTLGKKAYGYLGLGDVFVFVFFGIVGVAGVYPLLTGELNLSLLYPCITIGAFSTAVLNLNNMRDIENDAEVGKSTLVVRIGGKKAIWYHTFLILTGVVSWLLFLYFEHGFKNLSWCILVFFIAHLIRVHKVTTPKDFDPELKRVALPTFFLALSYALFVIIYSL